MNREELYLEIVRTLTEFRPGDSTFYAGEMKDDYLSNKIFNLVMSTKDPVLAWKLLKLTQEQYGDFFSNFDNYYVSGKDIDSHMEYIKGSSQIIDNTNIKQTY